VGPPVDSVNDVADRHAAHVVLANVRAFDFRFRGRSGVPRSTVRGKREDCADGSGRLLCRRELHQSARPDRRREDRGTNAGEWTAIVQIAPRLKRTLSGHGLDRSPIFNLPSSVAAVPRRRVLAQASGRPVHPGASGESLNSRAQTKPQAVGTEVLKAPSRTRASLQRDDLRPWTGAGREEDGD